MIYTFFLGHVEDIAVKSYTAKSAQKMEWHVLVLVGV